MKKGEGSIADEMRTEYKRSDFKKLERGRFYEKVVASSNVVVLEPRVAKGISKFRQCQSSAFQFAGACPTIIMPNTTFDSDACESRTRRLTLT